MKTNRKTERRNAVGSSDVLGVMATSQCQSGNDTAATDAPPGNASDTTANSESDTADHLLTSMLHSPLCPEVAVSLFRNRSDHDIRTLQTLRVLWTNAGSPNLGDLPQPMGMSLYDLAYERLSNVLARMTPNDQELSHAARDSRQPETRSEN